MKHKDIKFEFAEMPRSQIKTADYNPRLIDKQNLKALEKGIKENGLVEPLVWNKRTGNLVSGHQRLSILDKLERGKDFDVPVAIVDMDERQEAKLNIQLNNKSMQGEYNLDALGDVLIDFNLDFADVGFTDFDAKFMFGDDDKLKSLFPDSPSVEAAKEEIKAVKENRANAKEKYDKDNNADFWFTVVCKDENERKELFKAMNVPFYERFVRAESIKRLIETG